MTSTDVAIARVVATARERIDDHPALAPLLDDLPQLLSDLVDQWSLVLGDSYAEGLGGPVVAVEAAGRPAVLKIARVGPQFTAQVSTMEAARGRGYAAVLAADVARGAVLLERLGPSLAAARLKPVEQVRHLTATLRQAWEVPLEVAPRVPRGHDKAAALADLVERLRRDDDEQRWGRALDRAHGMARHLSRTRDPSRDVLCHGDPHPGNALRAQGIPRYRLVDPDGFRCEPEYDVGVVLRDFSRELLALGDLRRAQTLHDQLLREATAATGAHLARTREWAFVERVTTGLHLRWFDDVETADTFLDSAMVLLGWPPVT